MNSNNRFNFKPIFIGIIVLSLILGNQMMAFADNIKMPVAKESNVVKNGKAVIDISNVNDGYVMAKYTGSSTGTIKIIINKTDGSTYTYNIFNLNYS